MFSSSIRTNIDPATIFARRRGGLVKAQKWLDKRIMLDSDQFVPRDEGILAGSPRRATEFGSGKVVYDTPYARRQYYGVNFNFSRDKHPNATHHWFEKAKSIFLEYWLSGVVKIMGGVSR